jgi:hypothetical protein
MTAILKNGKDTTLPNFVPLRKVIEKYGITPNATAAVKSLSEAGINCRKIGKTWLVDQDGLVNYLQENKQYTKPII